jgi:hypothetical protein
MTDKDLDSILCERLKGCIRNRTLPDDFAGRLKASLRRSKRRSRLTAALSVSLVAVLCVMVGGLVRAPSPNAPGEYAIVAGRDNKPAEKISGWMLLGFFRDCFKRTRGGKRKEEE